MPRCVFKLPEIPHRPNDRRLWSGLNGSSVSLCISEVAMTWKGISLLVTSDSQSAYQLEQNLGFFLKGTDTKVLTFPDWETLPYDHFSPHQDIISERIKTLQQLSGTERGVVIIPVTTLMHRLLPSHYLYGNSLSLAQGDKFDINTTRKQLESAGYHCVDTVYEHSEFAVRGAVFDIFPAGSNTAVRIELFDDEIESLRLFDPDSQRSIERITKISLMPAREFPLTEQAIKEFKHNWREHFDVNYRECPVYLDVMDGIASPGVEYYLPFFFKQTSSFFDFLPESTLIMTYGDILTNAEKFWQECQQRYENLRYDITRPILPPHEIFLPLDEMFRQLKSFPRLGFSQHSTTAETRNSHSACYDFKINSPTDISADAKAEQPLQKLQAYVTEKQNKNHLLFCVESAGRREALLEQLGKLKLFPKEYQNWQALLTSVASDNASSDDPEYTTAIMISPLMEGAELASANITVITEQQLYGQRIFQHRKRQKDLLAADNFIKNLSELKLNAPVVHLDHGVGRYKGLQTLSIDNQAMEFLTLEYANEAKLYVPVASLHLISRYSGADEETAPMHKLGTDTWTRQKRKAAEKIHDVAAELLDIYARRAAREGYQYKLQQQDYNLFAMGFPFEETPDQRLAIEATLHDMTSAQPMDRLVCGDVGFGKTEVAMRACFTAVQNGKQVSVLVPTTLLAQQHYDSFKDRFADWPVQIEVLSRFRSAKEQAKVLEHLEKGKVDILIGTHKLLQEDVKFCNLGLMIIDEEHRFGVRHKEKLKAKRSNVDILTLTATPIPRTLNMAMSGIRDISIISTPPAKRLAVKTFVQQSQDRIIKEAILRELLRGGQVFYLHNEVKSIEKTAKDLAKLVPESRITIAHGQMRESELEHTMSTFYHKHFNVLVCTTIIETGIDIPNANTIIIDRADKLGLAQLHQLRGRVGRSHHQAYAYLLTPHRKAISKDGVKRLEAIADADHLGAGFTLASHDLEIRGAGELLGDEQSGHIQGIGFSLYMEMLEQAVEAIKQGKTPNLDQALYHGAEINLRVPALIPDDYLPDVHARLILYKRIANAKTDTELHELQVEMVDRFGLLPEPCKLLFRVTQIKLLAEALGIKKVDAGATNGRVEFQSDTQVDPLSLVKMVQSQPQCFSLDGADALKFSLEMESFEDRFSAVKSLLGNLTPKTEQATTKSDAKTKPSAGKKSAKKIKAHR